MLAHALFAITAAHEQTRHPSPDGLIPLTCNEIQHLFTTLIVQPVHAQPTGFRGPTGDDATKPAPATATTCDKQPRPHEDQDLRLEY